jgi:hypothetical protein
VQTGTPGSGPSQAWNVHPAGLPERANSAVTASGVAHCPAVARSPAIQASTTARAAMVGVEQLPAGTGVAPVVGIVIVVEVVVCPAWRVPAVPRHDAVTSAAPMATTTRRDARAAAVLPAARRLGRTADRREPSAQRLPVGPRASDQLPVEHRLVPPEREHPQRAARHDGRVSDDQATE